MKFLWLFLLLISIKVSAAITGQGSGELGMSRDEDVTNAGLGLRYKLSRSSVNTDAQFNSRMQLGSDRGRSLVATAAHQYQYENSFIDNDIYHSFNFISPRFNWTSSASHSIDFDNRVSETNGEVTTDYSSREESWSITTGPSFTYVKGRWFDFWMNTNVSRQYKQPTFTDETELNLGFAKSINKLSQLTFSMSQRCSQDDDSITEDSCRSEASLGVDTQAKNYSFTFEYGASIEEQSKTDIYSVSGNFDLNSRSKLVLTAYRIVDSIARQESDFEDETSSLAGIKEGRNIQYLYEWSRNRLELNARRLLSKSDNNQSISEDLSIYYDFQLSSVLCSACAFSTAYEYSRFDFEREQKLTSIGVSKRNSKKINSTLSFRRTERSEQETFWSINFLISYTGIASKISNR